MFAEGDKEEGMMSRNMLMAAVVAAATSVSAAEKQVKRSDLPAAVQRTLDTECAKAIIVGYAMDKEDGQAEYEVHLMINGHAKDMTLDSNGKVLEVEEHVAIDSL